MRLSLLVVISSLMWLVASPGHAQVFDTEDFNSIPLGDVNAAPAGDWTAMANVNVVVGGLNYQNGGITIQGGGRALQVGPGLPGNTINNYVDWSFTPTSVPDVWFSFLLQTSETASITAATDRNFFQVFFSESGDQLQSVSMVLDNQRGGDADHNFRARAGSSNQNVNGFTDNGPDPDLGNNQPTVTNLIVGHIEKIGDEYETVSIYANPATAAQPPAPTATATWEPLSSATLQQLTIRISGLESDDSYLIDEIAVGPTYASLIGEDPCPVQGDFNCNGMLDQGDYAILTDNLFEGTTREQGDFDFSGMTDLRDFLLFREAFAAANPGVALVPEPATMILMGLASSLLLCVRRRTGRGVT